MHTSRRKINRESKLTFTPLIDSALPVHHELFNLRKQNLN